MKIIDIKVTRENLVLTRPYTISYKTVDSVENIIIKLYLENGMVGLGACNPSKYVVGVNIDDTILNLTEDKLAFLKGADIRSFHDLLDKTYTNFSTDAGAKVLIDVALHDAFTQYLGIPLVAFYGQKIYELPTSVTIGIKDIEATLEEAKEYLDAGFNNIKVKLGQELKLDIERLRALRKTFGKRPIIRIDANQGWSKAETMDFFESVGDLEIELVEQPVKADQLMQLSSIPGVFKKLIAADESLVDSNDAMLLSKSPIPAGIFNIKLMKCGGIREAKKIAAIAEKASIELMWGCNDESIISISAALHAAFSCANTKYIDLDGSLDLAKDVVKGGFNIKNGVMSLTKKPGLGVELI
jgi:L-alanine-DL-glutamate epimerase-like enolase superfamily enzyme